MKQLLLVVALASFAIGQARAQSHLTVSGKITDEKGASIAGATITEKGTRNASTTHDDGTFSMNVKNKAKLIISYIGYESYETEAKATININLNPDNKALTDVVVTGLGTATSKKKVPIDVASVSSKDFAKSATTSIQQALDGQVAGARIQQNSGTPGATFNIMLRGITNLGGTNPLIMVDGVEMKDLTSIDPATVDRIEVVKGAAGGMLYGAQGANGIIQIFTKKGSMNSKISITGSSKVSIDNILRGNDIVSLQHHYVTDANGNILDAKGKPIARDSTGRWTDPQVPEPSVNPMLENNKKFNLPLYDHLDQAFRQALTFNNSVSISGGGPSVDYALTASQLNQQDVLSNNFRRSNVSVNLGIHPFPGFTLRSTSQGISGYENLLGGNRFNVISAYPFIDFTWKDKTGHFPMQTNASNSGSNTLSEPQWHQRHNQSLELFQTFNANYKFPRFVELDIKYGLHYQNTDGFNYYKNQTGADNMQTGNFWGNLQGSLANSFSKELSQNGLYSLYVRTDFMKDFHSRLPISTTTQFSYDYRKDDQRQYTATGTQLPTYPPVTLNIAAVKSVSDKYLTTVTFGYLANQTIDFGNLFGISAGVRSDFGSAFGSAQNSVIFPRGTVYFRPSELLKNLTWLSDWKLRAAYGKAGIQPNAYDRQITYTPATLGNNPSLATPAQATNDALELAISKELEIGTDVTFLPLQGDWIHRLSLSGTYWHRNSYNSYQYASVAPSTGYTTKLDNLSNIMSRGVDISIDALMYNSPNVIWNLGIRWGYGKSTVTKIAGGQDIVSAGFLVKEGKDLGTLYVQTPLHAVGQLMKDGKTPYISPANQQYYTVASTGMVVDTRTNMVALTSKDDLTVDGHAYPDFTSSLINNVTLFKNLNISFQFDFNYGGKIYNMTKQWLYKPVGGTGGQGASSADYDKKVTIAGKTGTFVNYYQSLYNLNLGTSPFVESGSYVRLRDLSLSYDLTRLIGAKAVKRLSVTASGRNLLTFTKYSGLDPENTGTNGVQTNIGVFQGVDYFGTPNLRSYQFAINFGF